jgi:hypothetical protein
MPVHLQKVKGVRFRSFHKKELWTPKGGAPLIILDDIKEVTIILGNGTTTTFIGLFGKRAKEFKDILRKQGGAIL